MAQVEQTLAEDTARCPVHQINLVDPELNQDPFDYFRRLRDEAPVSREAFLGMVHATRHEDILEVVRQPQVLSSEWDAVGGQNLGVELLPEELEPPEGRPQPHADAGDSRSSGAHALQEARDQALHLQARGADEHLRRAAFRIFLRRLKNIRLACNAGPIRYTPNHLLRGVAELRIEFDPA